MYIIILLYTSATKKDGKLKVIKHFIVNIRICFLNLNNVLAFFKGKNHMYFQFHLNYRHYMRHYTYIHTHMYMSKCLLFIAVI